MTAIAAALAFSSTPLFAQEVSSPPPVSDTAPTSTPPAADPLAPDPAPSTTATETTAAPAKPKATSTAKRTTSTTRTTTTKTASRSIKPVATSASAPPIAELAAPAPLPAESLAAAPVAPGPMPVAEPWVAAEEPQSGFAELDPDAAVPIAGAGALGLILLGGAAAVRRRKRRKQEEADEAAKWAFIQSNAQDDEPRTVAEPGFVQASAPQHDPVSSAFDRPVDAPIAGKVPIRDAPTTTLPEEFDLSRFGPHVQAAYRGPTTDNPSLSLKYRLRRASFLDQQERRTAETTAAKPRDIPDRGTWESRTASDFMFRRAGKPADKPAFQH